MTALTIDGPAIGRMVRTGSAGQVLSMAEITLGGRAAKLSCCRPHMAAFTGGDGMAAYQGKPGTGVLGNEPGRFPVVKVMTLSASQTHGRRMGIRMAAPASPSQIDLHWATVIMAA